MSVYQANVDPAERNTSHSLMLELVGSDRVVLDVGCASGYLAEALGKNGCLVSGIEYDEQEAEKARPFLQQLVVADLNQVDLAEQFPGSKFDVIVFGDVLEHLLNPAEVLKSSLGILADDGSVVISIPNVAHGSVRLALLQGRWKYTPTGLLDRTHIRFFTVETLLEMLHDAGLTATELRSTTADPLATEVSIDDAHLPSGVVEWVRHQAQGHSYQFVLSAKRAAVGDSSAEPEVVPAITTEPVHDVHTEVAELRARIGQLSGELAAEQQKVVDLRRAVLTSRDHAIGAEAQISRARAELAIARSETNAARVAAHDYRVELVRVTELAQAAPLPVRIRLAFAQLVGPRVWRVLTAPFRPIRKILTGRY